MAVTKIQGNPFNTAGDLPQVGSKAPEFQLTGTDLAPITLKSFEGKKVILNIFPSLDTAVCAASVRRFNAELNELPNTVVLCVSKDLPFAHSRFCVSEGLENVKNASTFRGDAFGNDYGTLLVDGPFYGLEARAVVVIGEDGIVKHVELVDEITNEPNYEAALAAL